MNTEELKGRTTQFAHRCVKLAIALPKKATGKTHKTIFNIKYSIKRVSSIE